MDDLHELVTGFSDAANYEFGRPGYSPEATAAIVEAIGVRPGDRVADLAAGTGKLTRPLLAAGLDVVAIEPFAPMRAELARHVDAGRILDGTAEAIPLADASVAAVTAASAFHWFDHDLALPEIHRVLRPGGALAIVGLRPSWRTGELPWEQELQDLVNAERPAHPGHDGPSHEETIARVGGFGPVELVECVSSYAATRETLLANLASMSWVGAMPDDERRELLGRANEILERHGIGAIDLPLLVAVRVTRPLGRAPAPRSGRPATASSRRRARP